MEHLIIDKTDDTPAIDFNPGTKELKISGRSLPEDVTSFYQPVLNWLDDLESSGGGHYQFIVNLKNFVIKFTLFFYFFLYLFFH